MFNKLELEISCVHCLQSSQNEIYPLINGNKDSKAKEMIMNEELFLYYCPHCGYYQPILYECIYYDEKLKYLVVLSKHGKELLRKIDFDISEYDIYFVSEVQEMKEKIIIKEHNLDNQVIEIMKQNIRNSYTNKSSYDLVLSKDISCFEMIYPNNEIIKTIAFDFTTYQKLLNLSN
ncbi:CpXC domain-containing protein [Thomasclavelia sp.]|uniref:CpXC domain-containing protein n=1 Tax=Thomasclavelia sp. TaxID=3025757 RepID=UPI0025D891D7|nr:CpXC domain-containing protein [Thomasclavelia sp.]